MRSVLKDGIIELVLLATSQALCPVVASFISKYPATVIFAFKNIDARFMEEYQVNLSHNVPVWNVEISQYVNVAGQISL